MTPRPLLRGAVACAVLVLLPSAARAYDNDGAGGGAHRVINRLALAAFAEANAGHPIFGHYDLAPTSVAYRLAAREGDHPFTTEGAWVMEKGDWPASERGLTAAILAAVPNTYAPSFVREEPQLRPFGSWVIESGFSADEPETYMALRHFYDPTATGLDTRHQPPRRAPYLTDQLNFATARVAGYANPEVDAKAWALEQSPYSLKAGWEALAAAATESDAEARSGKLALAWRALGETMHLLADMTVPAHVRNDGHPGLSGWLAVAFNAKGDPYEAYCTAAVVARYAEQGRAHPDALDAVARSRNPAELFDAVARYTNGRFFSRDTIAGRDGLTGRPVTNGNHQPAYGSPRLEEFRWRPTGKRTGYYETEAGDPVAWAYDSSHDVIEACVEYQARLLIPLAVQANVRLLDLALPRFRVEVSDLDRTAGRLRCRLYESVSDGKDHWDERNAERFPGTSARVLLLTTRGDERQAVWAPVGEPSQGELTIALPAEVTARLGDGAALTVGIDLGGILVKSAPYLPLTLAIEPARLEARAGEGGALAAVSQGLPAGARYVWDFGDGSAPLTSSDPSAHHTWRAGVYTVTLRAIDASGRMLPPTTTATVMVREPAAPRPARGEWPPDLDLVPREVVLRLLPPEAKALGYFEQPEGKVPPEVARSTYHGFVWREHAGSAGGGYRRCEGSVGITRRVRVDSNGDGEVTDQDEVLTWREVSWHRLEVRAALDQVEDWQPARTGALGQGEAIEMGDRAVLRTAWGSVGCDAVRGPLRLNVAVTSALQGDQAAELQARQREREGKAHRKSKPLDLPELQAAQAETAAEGRELAIRVGREILADWDRYYLTRPLGGNGFKGLAGDLEPYILTAADAPFLSVRREAARDYGTVVLERRDPAVPNRLLERYHISYRRYPYYSHLPLSQALRETRKQVEMVGQAYKHPLPLELAGADLVFAGRHRWQGNHDYLVFCRDNVVVEIGGVTELRSSLSPLDHTVHLARLALARLGGPAAEQPEPAVVDPIAELARYRLVRFSGCELPGGRSYTPAGLAALKAGRSKPEAVSTIGVRTTAEVGWGGKALVLPLKDVQQVRWQGTAFELAYHWASGELELSGSASGSFDVGGRVLVGLTIRETWHLRHRRDDLLDWDKDEYRIEISNSRTPLLGLGAETMDSCVERVSYAHSHSDNYTTPDRKLTLIYRETAEGPPRGREGMVTFYR